MSVTIPRAAQMGAPGGWATHLLLKRLNLRAVWGRNRFFNLLHLFELVFLDFHIGSGFSIIIENQHTLCSFWKRKPYVEYHRLPSSLVGLSCASCFRFSIPELAPWKKRCCS